MLCCQLSASTISDSLYNAFSMGSSNSDGVAIVSTVVNELESANTSQKCQFYLV